GGELDLLDARRRLTGHEVVVGGLAPDDAAEADDGVDPAGGGEDAGAHRELEAAGHGLDDDVVVVHAELLQAPSGALGEPLDDVVVPAGPHDADAQASPVEPGGGGGALVAGGHFASGASPVQLSRPSRRWPI